MIAIRRSIYNDIICGQSGNGIADEIPSILVQKMAEGHKVFLLDDESKMIIAQLVPREITG